MTEGTPSPILQFLPLGFLFFIFYFLLIRPQQKKQKEHTNMVSKLEKNDEIVTVGGVHATVVDIREKTAILRIAENVKIEIEKTSIAEVKKNK